MDHHEANIRFDEDSGNYPTRKRLRLTGFDYSSSGLYFVTICIQNMELRLGSVSERVMQLGRSGEMVARVWQENATRYPGIELDAFVVMPNHLHGIVFLGTNPVESVSGKTLSRIVQSFKSISTVEYTKGVREGEFPPVDRVLWQRGFHDRILSSQRALDAARGYIEDNPRGWLVSRIESV